MGLKQLIIVKSDCSEVTAKIVVLIEVSNPLLVGEYRVQAHQTKIAEADAQNYLISGLSAVLILRSVKE